MDPVLVKQLWQEIERLPIFDPHTHIRPGHSTALNIAEILSYHYYTELINSAEYRPEGFPWDDPHAFTRVVVEKLPSIANTVQYDWLMVISETFYNIPRQDWRKADNWQSIFERAQKRIDASGYRQEVIAKSNIRRVLLTNSYDEDLSGVDTQFYTPCLRVDPFMNYAASPVEWDKLSTFAGVDAQTLAGFNQALDRAFAKFVGLGVAYAALGTPPNLVTRYVAEEDAARVLQKAVQGDTLDDADKALWAAYGVNRIADRCRAHRLPFHLMIGANRGVYAHGVPSGMDLLDSVNSMRGYDYLFNEYPDVKFPVSVLADTSGLELTAAAWIRHNVYPSGHWWYSNQPTDIARELRRRLDTVPWGKLIGYYSDAYYLEFVLPKFRMFKFELTLALAERIERSHVHPNMAPFTVQAALDLAEAVLVSNPARILGLTA